MQKKLKLAVAALCCATSAAAQVAGQAGQKSDMESEQAFTIAVDGQQPDTRPAVEYDEGYSSGLGLLGGDTSGAQAEEAAFERDLRRRRKKRRKGQGL